MLIGRIGEIAVIHFDQLRHFFHGSQRVKAIFCCLVVGNLDLQHDPIQAAVDGGLHLSRLGPGPGLVDCSHLNDLHPSWYDSCCLHLQGT